MAHRGQTRRRATILATLVAAAIGSTALAQATADPTPHQAETSEGILPIPDYSGDLWSRSFLTGDWGGMRADLANKGVQFRIDWDQYVQGVVDGGRDTSTRYGGTLDYLINLDLMRMGVLDGALVKFRAESRYGHSVNGIAGPILPVNTDALFPLTDELDDDIAFTITDLNYTQFLSKKLAVMIGKVDTLDGDPNEFASGRGTTQFMNANFIFNPVLALRLPYSTLAAGVVWLPVQEKDRAITVINTVMNTGDSSTTTGFDDFGEGTSWNIEAEFQYRLGHLPGGQNVGFLYSFDQDFAQFTGEFVFIPGEGLIIPTTDETWALYWSAWQYLCVEDEVDAPIDLTNGRPDHRGIGLFARAGIADNDTNPVDWSISGGIGGRGLLPSRDNDTYGVGYFYQSLQSNLLTSTLGVEDHSQGFEAFYNFAITPAAHLTIDAQVVEDPFPGTDTSVIVGARIFLTF